MWKNIAETNIMIGTHADSLIAEAVKKSVTGFDRELAWQAVWKDATTQYGDREEVLSSFVSVAFMVLLDVAVC